MMGITNNGRRAAMLAMASVLALSGGATRAAEAAKPPPLGFIALPSPPTPGSMLDQELTHVAEQGNAWLTKSGRLREQNAHSAGLLLFAGFYGAAVTAFNPAPKNLMAAILGQGVGQAWNKDLKPGARSRIYRQGHRAMECVFDAGLPLRGYDGSVVQNLRIKAMAALEDADKALRAPPVPAPAPAKKKPTAVEAKLDKLLDRMAADADAADRKTLKELMDKLSGLDTRLAEEQGALEEAPFRLSRVRRQVEDAVEKRLDSAAPDYAGALKSLGETAKPAAPTPAAKAAVPMAMAPVAPSVPQAILSVQTAIRAIESGAPNTATQAFKYMGECVPKAG